MKMQMSRVLDLVICEFLLVIAQSEIVAERLPDLVTGQAAMAKIQGELHGGG